MTFFEAISIVKDKINEPNIKKITITIDYEDIDIEQIDGKWKLISDDICFKDCAIIDLTKDCKLTINYTKKAQDKNILIINKALENAFRYGKSNIMNLNIIYDGNYNVNDETVGIIFNTYDEVKQMLLEVYEENYKSKGKNIK